MEKRTLEDSRELKLELELELELLNPATTCGPHTGNRSTQ